MSQIRDTDRMMRCRQARGLFGALESASIGDDDRISIENHLHGCSRCSRKYRLFSLERVVLRSSGANEEVSPEDNFFVSLRARIERGPRLVQEMEGNGDRSSVLVWTTARQLLPAMAMLLLLIIFATLLWGTGAPIDRARTVERPMDRLLLHDAFDEPPPTQDDVLETLVALEEKENGR